MIRDWSGMEMGIGVGLDPATKRGLRVYNDPLPVAAGRTGCLGIDDADDDDDADVWVVCAVAVVIGVGAVPVGKGAVVGIAERIGLESEVVVVVVVVGDGERGEMVASAVALRFGGWRIEGWTTVSKSGSSSFTCNELVFNRVAFWSCWMESWARTSVSRVDIALPGVVIWVVISMPQTPRGVMISMTYGRPGGR